MLSGSPRYLHPQPAENGNSWRENSDSYSERHAAHVNRPYIADLGSVLGAGSRQANMAENILSPQKVAQARQVAEAYLAASRGSAGPGRAFEAAVQTYCRLQGSEANPADAARAVAAILATYDGEGLS
jgi:hypothetical protein